MGKKKTKQKKIPKTLTSDQDYYKAFGVEQPHEAPVAGTDTEQERQPEVEPEPEFAALLEESLKGKSESALLRAKQEKTAGSAMPLQRRLKRYPPPECELDLHGFQAIGARIQADSFIRSRKEQGVFTLRIIVGKGKHSEFRAVLPDVIEDVLNALKKDQVVLHYEWDRKRKSQSGAVIVYLKQFSG